MATTTISSREFHEDVTRAEEASSRGPVFITDDGQPAHVLLNIEEYERLAGPRKNIVDALSMPGLTEIEFEQPRSGERTRAADFS